MKVRRQKKKEGKVEERKEEQYLRSVVASIIIEQGFFTIDGRSFIKIDDVNRLADFTGPKTNEERS